MTGWLRAVVMFAVGVGAALIAFGLRPKGESLQTVQSTTSNPEAPAMCPWREPQHDMQSFFTGSDSYQTQTVALSRKRMQILKRLGPGATLDSNALYINRVTRQGHDVGLVMVRRTAGEFGGIEVVLGVHPDGRIAGVRIQRHREPPTTAQEITSERWLASFVGKTSQAHFQLGDDIPSVGPSAQVSAAAVAAAIRTLMIEYDETRESAPAPHH